MAFTKSVDKKNERENKMNEQELVQVSLTITNNCWYCLQIGEKCPECQDTADTNLTVLAHNVVDEGNTQYKYQWLRDSEAVSGHEWVSSTTRIKPYFVFATQSWEDSRDEFLSPIVHLEDRLDDRELQLGAGEKVCNDCNLTFNIRLSDCPTCVEVNA